MNLLRKSKKQKAEADRQRRRGTQRGSAVKEALTRDAFIRSFLFLGFGAAATLFAFFGLSAASPLVQKDQVSRIRITAEIPFSYVSQIETDRQLEAVQQRVPPVFRLDMEPYRSFRTYLEQLVLDIGSFAEVPENTPEELARLEESEIQEFLRQYAPGNPYNLRPSDIATLFNQLGIERCQAVADEGLIIIGEIFQKGVYQEDNAFNLSSGQRLTLFSVEDEQGNVQDVQILSEEEGLRTLRIQLTALDIPRESTVALFRILRAALIPNLVFDATRTNDQVAKAQDSVEPTVIEVQEGETIIEPNSRVTALQYEQLEAYREKLKASESKEFGINSLFLERAMLTLILVLGAVFFLRSSRHAMQRDYRIFSLSGAIILSNIVLIRLVIELGDSVIVESTPVFINLIPYLVPVILGPMVITILVGTGPGILSAILVSAFNAMMQGNSLSVFLLSQLVCLVAISYCRNIQLRASLVRAGLIAGGLMAIGALLFAIRDSLALTTVLFQVLTCLGTGVISGMLIVGLLPVLEQVFKYTTDITLLELTDYNHPLLRKMQIEAPGSYHHSLMVANLSENAAAVIGANPLICRVCSLFHDIGKMTKPDYFVENQRAGENPHFERNPSMSALVIKSHVKEGVQMAREHRLPRIIIDVIKQHHGTSLIQYFYYKALEKQRDEGVIESIYPNAPKIELNDVNEDTYRYEGPIPQFTESALIMLADCVEAASRSLKKATPQSISDLVDKIVMARMQDGQLDATPLTLSQLQKVKESFGFTLLNMLHARIEYPQGKPEKNGGNGRNKNGNGGKKETASENKQ
ncbi:MAG: HD family phosphohydrolase [Puniceicoccaceae bacterium]